MERGDTLTEISSLGVISILALSTLFYNEMLSPLNCGREWPDLISSSYLWHTSSDVVILLAYVIGNLQMSQP
jgi:hypothetical protein